MSVRKEIARQLGNRPRGAHKGDFGRVFILAGSRGMSGACYLASKAALRSGAGVVTVGVPRELMAPLARRFSEAMTLPLPQTKNGTVSFRAVRTIEKFLSKQDVFALGPGLSTNRETQKLIRSLAAAARIPIVIDADGLNAFKGRADELKRFKAPAVLTPHAGEFARLFGGSKPAGDEDRKKRALEAAKKFAVVLAFKGQYTVVASPEGKARVNVTGNPGMATAGSGDVLTGIIAAMLGQGVEPFRAACFGVYVHGLAGDIAARRKGEISLIAGDILEAIPAAFKNILGSHKQAG